MRNKEQWEVGKQNWTNKRDLRERTFTVYLFTFFAPY